MEVLESRYVYRLGTSVLPFMPLLTRRQPAYRHHKARNSAVVTIDGANLYLGPYDSP